MPVPSPSDPAGLTGRCYCARVRLSARTAPQVVTYCHCSDCRRVTGAPLAAFAAFAREDVDISPDPGPVSHAPGVARRFCRDCGSPLMAEFDYLPGQVFVPLGILDQAPELPPTLHCHAAAAMPWLHLDDGLPRIAASGRAALRAQAGTE